MQRNDQSAIASEYPVLFRYLGEVRFASCLRECVLQQSKPEPTWKQLAEELPERLSKSVTMAPEIAELACTERAMRRAFEAGEPKPNTRTRLHPSVSLLSFKHNSASLWSALMCDEPPPRPYRLEKPQHVLVWRHNAAPRMRLLGDEEYLCMISLTPRQNNAPTQELQATAFYVAGWLDSDVVLAATTPAEK
jgi:hypothetical protein